MTTFDIWGPCLVPNNDIGLDVGVKEANLLALTLLSAVDADTISGFCSTTSKVKRFYEGKSELIMNVEQLQRYLEEERGVTASRAENLAVLWGGAVVEIVVQMEAS